MYTGWDEKTFNRSGDLVSVAIPHTPDDSEMTSPATAVRLLAVGHQSRSRNGGDKRRQHEVSSAHPSPSVSSKLGKPEVSQEALTFSPRDQDRAAMPMPGRVLLPRRAMCQRRYLS